ncbi:glutamate receptor ionotropic, kainate 3-like [Ylistrum balloti]|uniref:glutamate receptor ionotropic, kainate 3-like n=1 Tax=Ylistrum balloti TaxID=509963 RepID=UPI00290585A1|nr:glutamate receptor ionotropic, kainate 3-like [Ylistrum balloti]
MTWDQCMELCVWTFVLSIFAVSGRSVTRIGVLDNLSDYQPTYSLRLTSTQPEVAEVLITWDNVQMNELFQVHQKVSGIRNNSLDILLICQNGLSIWDAMIFNRSSRMISVYSPETFFLHTGSADTHQESSALVFEANILKVDVNHSKISSEVYTSSVLETTQNISISLQWKSVAIIYDDDAASMVEKLTILLNREGMFVMSYPERDVSLVRSNNRTLLDDIYENFDEKGVNITVICHVKCVQRVLNQANLFDHMPNHKHQTAMRQRSRWFIITSAPDLDRDVGAYCYDLDNVAVFNLHQKEEEEVDDNPKTPSPLDIDSLYNIPSATIAASTGGINVTLSQHTFGRVIEALVDHVNQVPLCIHCDIYTLIWVKKGGKIRTMKDSRDRRSFQQVGHVNISGVRTMYGDIFPNVNFHFNGREFLTTTNWWPPFMDRHVINGTRVYFGFCQDMLDELASQLNFTYIMTEPADKEWGFMLNNGSWTGMIGELQREEVDMMIAPASIQAGREMVMDFTHPYYFDTSTILMKRPDPNKTKWRTLIDPFADIVHMCIWITLSLAALILTVLERINPFYRNQQEAEEHNTYQNTFWYMFGALLTQGGDRLPESQTGRTLISFWWLFSIVMVATYSGNLIAFLTVAKDRLPFNSLAELVAQSEYSWGTLGGTYFITMFKDSTLPVYLKVWDGVVKANLSDPRALSPDPAIHIQKILKEDYVYFGDKVVMDMRRVNDCRLVTVDEEIPNMSYGVGLPNHSPYTKIFSNKILELLESGIFSIYTHRHWPKVNYCKETVQASAKQISLIDVHSAFILIGIGITFGSVVLLVEFIVRYRYKLFSCVIPQKIKDKHVANKKFRDCNAVYIDGRQKSELEASGRRKSVAKRRGSNIEKFEKRRTFETNVNGDYG